ncbi:hypothetical protein [Phormidium tenue]|uniref:Uncharacterized protein n=1 Tax=Phormidium tenue FACHB-1050 TaxID=2692857 RepID=A0ABR8CEZ1_9CYAN|nr:hypothetical protein [Phormidium tenue]MBD2318940.1 hypothetical protein [Phormidium tenue FACHB-1050]
MDTATTKSSKLSELKSAIIREPLIVNAGATVGELIGQVTPDHLSFHQG